MSSQQQLTRSAVHIECGLVPYTEGLRLQHEWHAKVVAGFVDGVILSLEHPAVITFGRHAEPKHLHRDTASLAAEGVPVIATERGGEVTAHMPGQLVIYPILPLGAWGMGVRSYVGRLERSVIDLLHRYGLESQTREGYPGVWLGHAKICAVGIRVKSRTSLHGIALNICNDLSLFSAMMPCGIAGASVTRMADHLAEAPGVLSILPNLIQSLRENLQIGS